MQSCLHQRKILTVAICALFFFLEPKPKASHPEEETATHKDWSQLGAFLPQVCVASWPYISECMFSCSSPSRPPPLSFKDSSWTTRSPTSSGTWRRGRSCATPWRRRCAPSVWTASSAAPTSSPGTTRSLRSVCLIVCGRRTVCDEPKAGYSGCWKYLVLYWNVKAAEEDKRWNVLYLQVKYECLSDEIKIGDYYLRLLLEEDENEESNAIKRS